MLVMGKKLAIRGHSTRGKEVIELLEMMGGENKLDYIGGITMFSYYVSGQVIYTDNTSIIEYDDFVIFTLEEFLEKFPFKVGDKAIHKCDGNALTIKSMEWSEDCETMVYDFKDSVIVLAAEDLKSVNDTDDNHTEPSKMKNVLAELLEHIKTTPKEELEREFEEIKEWLNVGPTIEEFITFCECVNKKPVYPKTYNECYNILNCFSFTNVERYNFENDWRLTIKDKNYGNIMNAFVKLLICRDTYWKIAGEEMGLGKPWEPDLENEELYCIQNYNKQITISRTNTAFNKILIFPTEKMRDAFYENFKNLIEQCKELL